MKSLREILANNLKAHRRKCGISQAKLAEKAGITTQYVAMIELTRQFPTPEVLERIAEALEIEAYELFSVSPSPKDSLHQLRQQILDDLDRAIGNAVDKAIDRKLKGTEAKS